MFDPISASGNIKGSFIDYITTSFDFSDKDYKRCLEQALKQPDAIAKGPYLDIGGSYETGRTLREMIRDSHASHLFETLEGSSENDKELKLARPLYLHQEAALNKASQGKSLIITTGTGSGKTECFLIPIIDHLLREIQAGTLTNSVRAIIIYPMNALANDQMKRMRALLRDCTQIRFGLYNGNTQHEQSKALSEYRSTYHAEPQQNEVLSREEMQTCPPHILITNYSMMEYLLLRPKDDAVFYGAQLRYIILDEAHIYRGATGMETSLLLRRLQARLSMSNHVQYILTSATLGDENANEQILAFGKRLCGVTFEEDCIIRAKEKRQEMIECMDFPREMFLALSDERNSIQDVLVKYGTDFAPDGNDGEKLFELCLRSRLYKQLRLVARGPVTVAFICAQINQVMSMDEQLLIAFIAVCTRAEKDGANLIKARYHLFVRALEGAYVTLNAPKQLFLHRCIAIGSGSSIQNVFESAICTDCGRLAIAGKIEGSMLVQHASRFGEDEADYFIIKDKNDSAWLDAEEDEEEIDVEDYIVCSVCGACSHECIGSDKLPCEHKKESFVRVHRLKKKDAGQVKCPACGTGRMRRFYLGSEAATAVLGTELFEQLPEEEFVINEVPAIQKQASVFGKKTASATVKRNKARQFLCFSDSRSEAAFFATYMETTYQEFLRRRGIWQTAQKLRDEKRLKVSMRDFVSEMTAFFESNASFKEWDSHESVYIASKRNAWIAILNELYNARRATGLISMGVLSVQYRKNEGISESLADKYGLSHAEARALLELIVLDAVYTGAIDAGKQEPLSEAQREYIFFSPTPQKLVKLKQAGTSNRSYLSGWIGRKRKNGNYYPNTKITRLCNALHITEEEADELLADYWDNVFDPEKEEFVLDACDFDVLLYDFSQMPYYRCSKCGRVTPHNVRKQCVNVKCDGKLEMFNTFASMDNNHYANLYRSTLMHPLFIKEHTAQLAKKQQTKYQEAFVNKRINALSCSTTFEMGVDVGSLETVYMRNIPPSPSNYVQRAGRAGRQRRSAAFVLTYAKLSSHDFTYFSRPEDMISGKISAPIFELENEKIMYRHIFAVALSYFFALNPDVYDGDDRNIFMNEGGYGRLKKMLTDVPSELRKLLKASIPAAAHVYMGIDDDSWVEKMTGEGGVLEIAYQDFAGTLDELCKARDSAKRRHDLEEAGNIERQIKYFRAGKNDECGKRRLIDFLVRNNVLPKYGFPVDTVELLPDINAQSSDDALQLSRDLQIAIAEYAPGSEIIADGKLYTSRYIRRMPGKNSQDGWERGMFSICPDPNCKQLNFTKDYIPKSGRECVSCHSNISFWRWSKTIEPRRGFLTDGKQQPVPMRRPERGHKTDDYYIGDPHSNTISKREFMINERNVLLESTTNDSLVVVGDTEFYVCPVCGYAEECRFPDQHKNARGYQCTYKSTDTTQKYRLSHDFKTDVAKITFLDSRSADLAMMLSVMYALLEGLCREMGIERTDVKGCLHKVYTKVGMLYSLVLYDSVAGGAGHVRRMITDDAEAFRRVIISAIRILESCRCDISCYHCLRNYYNQKIHDVLSRKIALAFLNDWTGIPQIVEQDIQPVNSGKVKITAVTIETLTY
jgi:ATP-dependent helicase YprA (DUF1998 family)